MKDTYESMWMTPEVKRKMKIKITQLGYKTSPKFFEDLSKVSNEGLKVLLSEMKDKKK